MERSKPTAHLTAPNLLAPNPYRFIMCVDSGSQEFRKSGAGAASLGTMGLGISGWEPGGQGVG